MPHEFEPGDVVTRISYGNDVFFKIVAFYEQEGQLVAQLHGIEYRLCADAPLNDLQQPDPQAFRQYQEQFRKKNLDCLRNITARRCADRLLYETRSGHRQLQGYDIPGKVLHLDGDKNYLEMCLGTYKQLNIPAMGFWIAEKEQPEAVKELLRTYSPDLLVLTGHDGLLKGKKDFSDVANYHNSHYFIEAVKTARSYEKSRDELVIFAGACQSHYEGIIRSGANFASSPLRVLIHAYDPVFVVEKIAYTSIYEEVSLPDIIKNTITGFDGVGGVDTRGKYRLGVPKSPY